MREYIFIYIPIATEKGIIYSFTFKFFKLFTVYFIMSLTYRFRIHRKYTIVAKAIKVTVATFIAGKL